MLDHGQKVALELNPKTHKVHLACGRYEANVAGIDAEDFPPIPAVSGGASFSIPAGVLKEAINEVAFAAAPDDTRPVLAGVLLKMGGGTLTLAAADGFRLAVRTVELPDGGPDLQMIVPAKTLTEVARLLTDDADDAGRHQHHAQRQPGLLRLWQDRNHQPSDRRPVPRLPAHHPARGQDESQSQHHRFPARHPRRRGLCPRQLDDRPPGVQPVQNTTPS